MPFDDEANYEFCIENKRTHQAINTIDKGGYAKQLYGAHRQAY